MLGSKTQQQMLVKSIIHARISTLIFENGGAETEEKLKKLFGSGKRWYYCMASPGHCTLEELLILSDTLKVSPTKLFHDGVGKQRISQRVFRLLREHEQMKVELDSSALPIGATVTN
jgi:hypothetical protein